jgi:uncharacterized protein YbjT (DUF2867 family)
LTSDGHAVIGISRDPDNGGLSAVTWLRLDITRATESDWTSILSGIDAVVNCAGVLQDAPGVSTAEVHATAASSLFHACNRAGVRRVVHLSAIGVDRETPSEFSRTKLAGDEALMDLDFDWVILRPSVVIGRAAYGGSALLRGLASLPIIPFIPDTAPLQLVHLDDLVEAVAFFVRPESPSRQAIEVVGPRRYSFEEAVRLFRKWLRRPPARAVKIPPWLAGLTYRLGDWVSLLGWQPPVRTTARLEMARGAIGDPAQLAQLSGITPRDPASLLAREPVSVQERWFSGLYVLKPLIFGIFALFWITTGLVSLGPGRERGIQLVMEGGTSETIALLATLSGGFADVVIGILIAFRRTSRLGLYAALAISITYAIIGTILVPRLWIDPLGPMLKIAPVMVFNLVALAILDER